MKSVPKPSSMSAPAPQAGPRARPGFAELLHRAAEGPTRREAAKAPEKKKAAPKVKDELTQAFAAALPLQALQAQPSHPDKARPASAGSKAAAPQAAAAARTSTGPEGAVADSPVRAPLPESSAQPAVAFSPAPAAHRPADEVAVPAPAFVPAEAALDETARLALFPSSMRWTSDQLSLALTVRGNEVSLRARGELAASLKASEAELRVALAQEGLRLKEADASGGAEHRRGEHDRRHQRSDDEWT